MKKNILSQEFDKHSLIKYALPTIIMMVFMSTYSVVDGVFVARFINEDALSAVNIVYPIINFVTALALMLATGANAIIARLMGERKNKEAKEFLTVIYIIGIIFGIILSIIILLFSKTILNLLGTNDILYAYANDYLVSLSLFFTMLFLQIFTQLFFVAAGKPSLGFISCLLGGIANIILDYVFIVVFDLGIRGAGLATGVGFTIPGLIGILYFSFNKKSTLHFTKPKLDMKKLIQSLYNGMSEFVGNISTAITTLCFNIILLKIAGIAGIASISVILYIQMIQTAIYIGFSIGVSPIISYKFGEQNYWQLKKIIKISFIFIGIISLVTILLSVIFADKAVSIFISSESKTFAMAKKGLIIFSLAYAFMGFNIFTSAMFTALSNGKVSAILSISRSLVFVLASLLILPHILGINGVWLAIPLAELLAIFLAIKFYKKNKIVYNY